MFISGLQLSPAAFGAFSTTHLWNPKSFSVPTPNNGTTWSSSCTSSTGSFYAGQGADKGFDGNITTPCSSSTGAGTITFEPSAGITVNSSIRITSNWNANPMWTTVWIDDIQQERVGLTGSGRAWQTIYEGCGKLTKLLLEPTNASKYAEFDALEVDGVILVDDVTDPTTRNNVNNGTTWSSLVTGTAYTNQGGDKAFDGKTDTMSQASNPGEASLTFKPTTAITGRVEILIAAGDHGGAVTGQFDLKIGNVSKFDNNIWPDNTTKWVDLGTQTIDTTHGLVWGNSSGGNWHGIKMIKIDGNVMLDDATDNSFHLKFNDTSLNRYLGKDTFNGKIADATGGLPIYNTTGGYGDIKGSGYRSDSSAGTTDGTGLILAVPGDSVETATCDVHQNINTGSSNVAILDAGDRPVVSTAESRLYGSSLKYYDFSKLPKFDSIV